MNIICHLIALDIAVGDMGIASQAISRCGTQSRSFLYLIET